MLRDRFRTMINVEGDAIGAGIVAHLSRVELEASAGQDKDRDAHDPNMGFDEEDIPYTTDYSEEKAKPPPENGAVNPTFFFNDDEIHTEL